MGLDEARLNNRYGEKLLLEKPTLTAFDKA